MQVTGEHNVNHSADRFGFRDLAAVHWNLGAPSLYEFALKNNEAQEEQDDSVICDVCRSVN